MGRCACRVFLLRKLRGLEVITVRVRDTLTNTGREIEYCTAFVGADLNHSFHKGRGFLLGSTIRLSLFAAKKVRIGNHVFQHIRLFRVPVHDLACNLVESEILMDHTLPSENLRFEQSSLNP